MNPDHPMHDRRGAKRQGSASVLILVATIPLLLALGALLTISVGHHAEAEQSLGQTTAAMSSFAGAQDALSRLEAARTMNGAFDLAINGGTAHVTGTPWLGDGVDNDKNGLIDDAEEKNIFAIHSEAWLNATAAGEIDPSVRSFHAVTDVVAEVVDFEFAFGQAIYIDDPKAKIDLNGGSFTLSGNDENLDLSKGPDPSRPAVGVNGDPSGVISQVANNQRAHIIGDLPDPAIGKTDPLDYDKYQTMLSPLATMNWSGSNATYSGAIGDYQKRKGIIAHATGNLKLHGTTTGAGILIVDGDLEIDGNFKFAGLLIVHGNVSFQGGGAKQELLGALLLWGKDPQGAPKEDLEVDGSVQIAYSSQGLALASASGGVKVMYWREQ